MTNTNVIAVSPSVAGNIGSCSIISTNIAEGTFHTETMAVNSCTGEVVSSSQPYIDPGAVFIIGFVSTLIVFGICVFVAYLLDIKRYN